MKLYKVGSPNTLVVLGVSFAIEPKGVLIGLALDTFT